MIAYILVRPDTPAARSSLGRGKERVPPKGSEIDALYGSPRDQIQNLMSWGGALVEAAKPVPYSRRILQVLELGLRGSTAKVPPQGWSFRPV